MTCFVNVYEVHREYGGPEEGGWYYDASYPEKAIPTTTREAREVLARVEAEFSNEGRRELSSVLSDGRYSIRLERTEFASQQTGRPHYE